MFFTCLFSNNASPKTKWDWILLLVGIMMVGTGVSYLYLEDKKKMKHLLLSHLGIWGGLSLVIISFIIGVQTNRNGIMLLIIPGLVLFFASLIRKNVVEKRYAITYVDPFEQMRETRFNGLMNFLRSELRVTTAQEIDFVLDEITEDSNRSSWKWNLPLSITGLLLFSIMDNYNQFRNNWQLQQTGVTLGDGVSVAKDLLLVAGIVFVATWLTGYVIRAALMRGQGRYEELCRTLRRISLHWKKYESKVKDDTPQRITKREETLKERTRKRGIYH
jgi:hypothetical protein